MLDEEDGLLMVACAETFTVSDKDYIAVHRQ